MDNLISNLSLEIKNENVKKINIIPKTDERYNILREIPIKNFDPSDGITYVYLNIDDFKDIFITHDPNFDCIQYQILGYEGNTVFHIDGHMHFY
jgi:hypothetical protein